MCIVEGLAASLASPHQMLIALSFPSCDSQKCLQALSNVVNHNFSPNAQENPLISIYLMEYIYLLKVIFQIKSKLKGDH